MLLGWWFVRQVDAVPIDLAPAYLDLAFLSPLSDSRADRLVRFLGQGDPGLVLDVGCGWAELLLRAISTLPDCHGLGVDLDADAVAHGRRLAAARGLDGRVTLSAGDAKDQPLPDAVDALICIGASQIWGPPPAEDGSYTQPLDYDSALTAIRALVPRGGRVVYGEAIWSTEPTREATEPFTGRDDEYLRLADLVETVERRGFVVMAFHESDLAEWDIFESGCNACYARWLTDHDPYHPDFDAVRLQVQERRQRYLKGYRGVLGMAYLELLAI